MSNAVIQKTNVKRGVIIIKTTLVGQVFVNSLLIYFTSK